MIIDFSSLQSSNETLSKLLTIPSDKIHDVKDPNDRFNNYEWIEPYIKKDCFYDYSNLSVCLLHTTTTGDIDEILNGGLSNLKTVLSTKNFLNDFFSSIDISFDINEKKIFFKNETIVITPDNGPELMLVHNRIYNDYNVNGFYFGNTEKTEYSCIDEMPEILYNTLEVTYRNHRKIREISQRWKEVTSRYRIKSVVPISKIDLNSENYPFYIISKLLDIYFENSEEIEPYDRYIVYLKRDETVSPDEIIDCTKLS